MLAPSSNVIFPLAFRSVNEVQRRPRLLFYISWNTNGKFSPLAPVKQMAKMQPWLHFNPFYSLRAEPQLADTITTWDATVISLSWRSAFLSVNIVYSEPLPQGKFYPHCSPESSPGPSPDAGCCPESLLHWNHPWFKLHLFLCWILPCPIGPSVPYTIRFDAVGVPLSLQSSGKMFPWKHCWWDLGRILAVLLDTLLPFHRHWDKVMPFLQGERSMR